MKKYVAILFFIVAIISSGVTQDLNWIGWDNLHQYNPMVPGQLKQDTGLTIVLPGLSFTSFHSGPAIGEYFLRQSAGVYSLDFSQVIDDFEDLNDMSFQLEIPVLAVDFRRGNNMFTLAYGIATESAFTYTKDFINLYQYGNAAYIDQTMDLSHQLSLSSYHKLQVGYARAFGNFNVGGRFKVLSGISDISTPFNQLGLYTDPDIYQLSLTAEEGLVFNTSGGLNYNGIDDISIDFSTLSYHSIGKNIGYGLDLGIYGKTGKLSYAASLLDQGTIKWSSDSKQYKSKTETIYEGLDLLDFFDDSNDIVIEDSLKSLLDLEEVDFEYSTELNRRVNLMVAYDLSNRYGVSVYYNMNSSRVNLNALGLINKFYFGQNQLNLMLSTVAGKIYVGSGLMFSLGPVQLIASADNILGLIDADNTNYASARLGINVSF